MIELKENNIQLNGSIEELMIDAINIISTLRCMFWHKEDMVHEEDKKKKIGQHFTDAWGEALCYIIDKAQEAKTIEDCDKIHDSIDVKYIADKLTNAVVKDGIEHASQLMKVEGMMDDLSKEIAKFNEELDARQKEAENNDKSN